MYLTGYGYAPQFTVTWPDGQTRTGRIQWRPVDRTTFLSEGATKLERPGVTDPEQRRTSQLALTGQFAPTAATDAQGNFASAFPDLRNPVVQLQVLRGDLGIDDGRGQSIFSVDQRQVDSGALKRVGQADLAPGESMRLDAGSRASVVWPSWCDFGAAPWLQSPAWRLPLASRPRAWRLRPSPRAWSPWAC